MLFSAQLHERVRSKQCAQLYIRFEFLSRDTAALQGFNSRLNGQHDSSGLAGGQPPADLKPHSRGPLMGPCTCEEALPGKIECINARGKKPSSAAAP